MKAASPTLRLCQYSECRGPIRKRYREGQKKFLARRYCQDSCYKAAQRSGDRVEGTRFKKCRTCGTTIARKAKMSSAEWAAKKYCKNDCKHIGQLKEPPPLAGPVVEYDVDNPPPCFLNSEFFEFEKRIQGVLERREATKSARPEYIQNMLIEAQRRWCGGCPIRDACLSRGEADGYDGIAGGRWLRDGVAQ